MFLISGAGIFHYPLTLPPVQYYLLATLTKRKSHSPIFVNDRMLLAEHAILSASGRMAVMVQTDEHSKKLCIHTLQSVQQ